jgi:poly(3-hydroxybutyrate) depolymerase
MGVGHYGVFNGSRYRREVVPMICDFTRSIDAKRMPDRLAS